MWLDMRMHVCIFESLQLEGSYVRDLLVTAMEWEEDRGWGYMEGSDYIHGPWKLFEEKEEWGREGESINIEELMRSKGTSRWCLKRRISDPWSWPGLWNGRGGMMSCMRTNSLEERILKNWVARLLEGSSVQVLKALRIMAGGEGPDSKWQQQDVGERV